MHLAFVDWFLIIAFFVISFVIGVVVSKKAGSSSSNFFLSGRNMPWWLLGVSMVATTFATDTPNNVTDMVRQNGVAGNWAWWSFLLTGMLTVFVYAKLWRRSGLMTDIEFYEIRYSGKAASFLRGFRALYLGVFFNIVIMASVTLAAIKIGGVLLGLTPFQTVAIAATVTVIYSALGGLRGVLITDFVQFSIAMIGSIWAAKTIVGMEQIGGLSGLLNNEVISGKLNFIPSLSDKDLLVSVLIIPLAVQWWSVWYPGAEPGGGGYIAQRMLAAKNEKHATGATLFFNFAHYALRPWPWIIIALASLIIYPDLESLRQAFPHIDASIVKHDLAYSAMLTFLPAGLLGVVLVSLIAAYMSTISTHLNWGSSYVVNDFYQRFVNPQASEKELVLIGRVSTAVLMVGACILAPYLENAKRAFDLLLQIGAGTGLLFILRWFWWRINAFAEIAAMVVSFIIAFYLEIIHPHTNLPELAGWVKLVSGISITTVVWVLVMMLTRPTNMATLISFYKLVHPGGSGWKKVINSAKQDGIDIDCNGRRWDLPYGIVCMVLGCLAVYGALFATGSWIYGRYTMAIILTFITVFATAGLICFWQKLDIH